MKSMWIQALAGNERLQAQCNSKGEARRQFALWLAVGWKIDSAEIVDGEGEVAEFYENGRWKS